LADHSDWRVPDDFWMMQRRVRRRRTIVAKIEGEPASKGRRGDRLAADIQREVIDSMKIGRQYPFTGPVALDLYFFSNLRNPPSIHSAAKYMLDVLGATSPGNVEPRRQSVLYKDDRQVKFLYVDLSQAWPLQFDSTMANPGHTYIFASPGRDVTADLRLAYELDREDDGRYGLISPDIDSDTTSPFYIPDLSDNPDAYWLDEPPPVNATPGKYWLYEQVRFNAIVSLQESLLARNDAILSYALADYLETHKLPTTDVRSPMYSYHRKMLLSDIITLAMPGLPSSPGSTIHFKQQVRAQFEALKQSSPLLTTLLTPVKLVFLVIPPEQGKDLDNIPLAVLPIAHDVLKPHIQPHMLAPKIRGLEDKPWWTEAKQRLRSVNANSVTAYQVVELPRSPSDPPEGVFRIALGRNSRKSWWHRTADYLDALIERHGRRL
jgi:hypothetical protein